MCLCSGDPGRSQLKNARHNEIPLTRERERERERGKRMKEQEQMSKREPEKYKQNIPLKLSL